MSSLTKDSVIAVLCGGSTEERQLSLQGGQCLLAALTSKGYSNVSIINVAGVNDILKDIIVYLPQISSINTCTIQCRGS
jgi:hypothetical protein